MRRLRGDLLEAATLKDSFLRVHSDGTWQCSAPGYGPGIKGQVLFLSDRIAWKKEFPIIEKLLVHFDLVGLDTEGPALESLFVATRDLERLMTLEYSRVTTLRRIASAIFHRRYRERRS